MTKKMNGIFITGTNTNVGKTQVATLLARALQKNNISVAPRKPVESGCIVDGNELIPQDAVALKNAAGYSGSLAQVCPFRFEPPISPVRAAHLANQALTTEKVAQACTANVNEEKEFLLVEGAGGFYSPLCEDGLNADLAQALKLPVILVAQDKLGCINDVLLSVQAIQSRELNLVAVILNQTATTDNPYMNNEEDLNNLINYPVFNIPYLQQNMPFSLPEKLLNIILDKI
ncbi:MAG: dethiobiotin synthase [Gammaproteobacteria bacterium]|nr:dethiobiotin synthase [Gammaproteobacteria bacterium]MCW8909276.1 dethiobiotin synthase [Gammaproteobacteria bacterium]MCW9056234.1 dethiobiotin synthase [Gammaproteobacteria bacterium]